MRPFLGLAGAAILVLAGIILAEGDTPHAVVALGAGLFGLLGLAAVHTAVAGQAAALDRLAGDAALAARAGEVPARWGGLDDPLLARLAAAMAACLGGGRTAEARLAAIVAALDRGVVVITATGLVGVVNGAARAVLGNGRAALGTSVFDALDRVHLEAAIQRALGAGRQPVGQMLRTVDGRALPARVAALDEDGAVLLLFEEGGAAGALEADLALFDGPPAPAPLDPAGPLAAAPLVVVDCETTGMDPARDRVLSIAIVRQQGARLYVAAGFDRLVDPGIAVPPESAAIHGLTEALLRGQPDFAALWPEIACRLAGAVFVGHHAAFDVAMIAAEARRAGHDWAPPAVLDVGMLFGAVEEGAGYIGLDTLAGRLGVPVRGRHTALGDALITGDIMARLLPRLAARGITTLGQALAVATPPPWGEGPEGRQR
ncbi:MAG: hypothetical protein OHK0024_07110 [Thalassobaculales bacterium]